MSLSSEVPLNDFDNFIKGRSFNHHISSSCVETHSFWRAVIHANNFWKLRQFQSLFLRILVQIPKIRRESVVSLDSITLSITESLHVLVGNTALTIHRSLAKVLCPEEKPVSSSALRMIIFVSLHVPSAQRYVQNICHIFHIFMRHDLSIEGWIVSDDSSVYE